MIVQVPEIIDALHDRVESVEIDVVIAVKTAHDMPFRLLEVGKKFFEYCFAQYSADGYLKSMNAAGDRKLSDQADLTEIFSFSQLIDDPVSPLSLVFDFIHVNHCFSSSQVHFGVSW